MNDTRAPVLTKTDFYARWEAMEFGNRPQTWPSPQALLESNYNGLVTLRYAEVDSRRKAYGAPQGDLRDLMQSMGGDPRKYRFSAHLPSEDLVMQGEVMDTPAGVYLAYTKMRLPGAVRLATCTSTGIRALGTLKRTLDPQDVSDLRDLLVSYPGHVIEFGVYRKRVGVLHRRMVVWEVRSY